MSQESLGAVIVVEAHGTVLVWSDEAATLYGYAESDIVGKSMFDIIVPADLINERLRWRSATAGAGRVIYESERLKKSGERIQVEVSVRAHEDSGSSILVLSERGITARLQTG